MIHSRGANASDAEIVWSQLLQGIGGGFTAVAQQVSAQASVPHADVAMVTAVVLLLTEIGGAIGSAIGMFCSNTRLWNGTDIDDTCILILFAIAAGSIWTHLMPGRLARYLPALSADQRAQLFWSITAAAAYPRGDPIREGVIHGQSIRTRTFLSANDPLTMRYMIAYDDVMKILTIAATVFAVVPFLLAFSMPDWYLGDQQNAVENVDLAGEKVENPDMHI
jgi:hypothetical protein